MEDMQLQTLQASLIKLSLALKLHNISEQTKPVNNNDCQIHTTIMSSFNKKKQDHFMNETWWSQRN